MSYIKPILKKIIRYYKENRQIGHTHTTINGINDVSSVFVSNIHVRDRVEDKSHVISLSEIEQGKLTEYNLPLVFDNSVLFNLFSDSIKEISTLENQIKDLQTEIHYWERKARNQDGQKY